MSPVVVAVVVAVVVGALLAARLTAQAPSATPAPAAASTVQTPQRETESAMLRWGATVVWFHATDADSVLVFASAGFRNPFAHPVAVSADDIDRWAVFATRLTATPGPTPELPASTSRASPDQLSDTTHTILGAGDVVLEITSDRDGLALRMNIGANRQDGLLATLFPDAAPAAAAALHDAARTARVLHRTALAAAAAAAIPAPVPATASAAPIAAAEDPSAQTALAQTPAVQTPAGQSAAAATTSPQMAPASPPAPPAASAPHHRTTARSSARSASAPPSASSASQPVIAVSVHTATASLSAPAPVAAAPATASPASSTLSAVSLASPTPGLMPVVISATVSPATAHPAASANAGDRGPTGLDDVTVDNLVRQWQSELMYCYTEYGLRSHPDLAGAVRVRVTLSPEGAVGHAAIVHRSWSGDGATDVESCIRSRVAAWRFPPAPIASTHEFPLSFQR